jgi:hypothetical protein
MHSCSDVAHVYKLTLGELLSHGIDPFAVVNDLFRNHQWLAHLVEDATDLIA